MNRLSFLLSALFLFLSISICQGFSVPRTQTTLSTATVLSITAEGPAVLEPPAVKEKTKEKESEEKTKQSSNTKHGGWAVRLFNDPMNKREFVALCLAKVCGLSDGQAYQVMMQAHQNGVSVIGRYDFERAEMYRDSLVGEGLVCDMIPVEDD